jgi:hypothetical protein
MKKNDWLLAAGTTLFSFLFYDESAGLNFLLFSLVATLLLLLKDRTVIESKGWWGAAAATVFTGFAVFWFGNALSVIANIIALALLSCLSVSRKSSVFVGVVFSFFSLLSSFVFMIIDAVNRVERRKKELIENPDASADPNKRGRLFLIFVPIILVLLFFVLYRGANPVFYEFTKDLNLDFITIGWVMFSILGFLLLYGFLYHRSIEELSGLDNSASNDLKPQPPLGYFDRVLSVINENLSGLVLLFSLNALLLFVNIIDVNFLYMSAELPGGMVLSDNLHQSVGTLIFSILLAIGIILFYFRGRLNFYPKNAFIKWLAYLWMIQNVVVIASTAYRNHLYIEQYSLTYKRIGVYVWLVLTLIGLLFTLLKVAKRKSNWFLVRSTGWAFFAVLVLSSAVNWSSSVADYNIKRSAQPHADLDVYYLKSLGPSVLPMLVDYGEHQSWEQSLDSQGYDLSYNIDRFVNSYEQRGWRSYCRTDAAVYKQLMAYERAGVIEITREEWQDRGLYYD